MTNSGALLVMGAGGRIGSALVSELDAAGSPVRAGYHDPGAAQERRDAGRDAVAIELADPATLWPALDGVETVFLLTPETPDQPDLELAVIRAAEATVGRRIVKPVGLARRRAAHAERAAAPARRGVARGLESDVDVSATGDLNAELFGRCRGDRPRRARPTRLQRARGIHRQPRRLARGHVVLTTKGHDGRMYALTGPEALTYRQAAATFAACSAAASTTKACPARRRTKR